MDLSIIVPCFNEEGSLPQFLDAVVSTFEKTSISYELILVNDGSRDATESILSSFAHSRRTSHVTVIGFSRNFGKEAALFAGLQHSRGEITGFIDADLQQTPETLLDMYRILISNPDYDCVTAYQQKRREAALQSFFKEGFYRMFNAVSSTNLAPDASDFRIFRRNVADAVLGMPEYYRFSKGIFAWVGFRTYLYPYTPEERVGGQSKWSFKKLMHYALNGMMSFSTLPLKLATWVGTIASVAAVIYTIDVIIETYVLKNTPAGYPTIVCLILLLGGLTLLTLGIIGEYLARIYVEGKHRPIYIAKDVLTMDDGKITLHDHHVGSPLPYRPTQSNVNTSEQTKKKTPTDS
jgi:glycosyltransferase involved in cell wall biosynthesis